MSGIAIPKLPGYTVHNPVSAAAHWSDRMRKYSATGDSMWSASRGLTFGGTKRG